MKENVGAIDRIGRSILGPALLILGYKRWGGERGNPLGLLAMMSGVSVLESAITRVCPINAVLGIDTRNSAEVRRDLARELTPDRLERIASQWS